MSAFQCTPEHIAVLAHFANRNDIYLGARWNNPDATKNPVDIAEALAIENNASLDHRYPKDADKKADQIYFALCKDSARKIPKTFSAVEIIKLAQCYDYQACEHPEYEASDAKQLIKAIISKAITKLPGYESAPWGL